MVKSKTKYQKYQNSKPILINKIHQNTNMSWLDQTTVTIIIHYRSGFRKREKMRSRSMWVSAMDLQPWGFGHGSLAMDLEKMNTKFKT